MTKAKSGRKKLDQRAFEVAARIKQARMGAGYSVDEISQSIGVPIQNYKSWECQFGTTNERKNLIHLVEFYEVSEDWFKFGIDTPYIGRQVGAELNHAGNARISLDDRVLLAKRAKDRRVLLGYSSKDLSALSGLSYANLNNYEKSRPVNFGQAEERALESLLQVPIGWLIDLKIEAPAFEKVALNTVQINHKSTSAFDEVEKIACWLSIAQIRKKTSDYDQLSEEKKRSVDIFLERYGRSGEKESTLQSVGDKFNLTRERVRQIIFSMSERAAQLLVKTPFIDEIVADINNHLPSKISALDERYKDLLGNSFSIESLDRFCREILGKSIIDITENPSASAFRCDALATNPHTHEPEVFKVLREESHRMIRACGGAQIHYVAGRSGGSMNKSLQLDEVIRCLKVMNGFEWLSEDEGWFWFGSGVPAENKLYTVTKKILAVVGAKLDVEEIVQGLLRSRREKYEVDARAKVPSIETPISIALEILKRAPFLKVIQHDDLMLTEKMDVKDHLSSTELDVFHYMAKNKGMTSRHSISKHLIDDQGMLPITLNWVLDNSPIITKLDSGIFSLRGWPIDLGALTEALNTVNGTGARNKKLAVDKNDWLTINSTLSQYNVDTRMFIAKKALNHNFSDNDEFFIEGLEGKVTLRVYKNNTCRFNGLVAKLLQLDIRAGVVFDLKINQLTREIKVIKN